MMEFVEFPSGPNLLRGVLHLPPDRRPPFGCVMFCHGLTGQRIESHFLFVTLARALSAEGLAALCFDFAGSGESDGAFEDMTASGELADAGCALDFLRRHPAIDPGRIGALGLSLGGCVTALLAGRRGGEVRAVALLSAVADPPRIAANITFGEYQRQLAARGWMDLHGLKLSQAFFDDFVRLEPVPAAAGYPGPLLLLHGSNDTAVPDDQARMFHAARAGSPHPTQLTILPGADHTFDTLPDTDKVRRLTVDFFAAHLAGR